MNPVILSQLVCTSVLVGLIWTVQVVHYPLFACAGREGFVVFHAEHSRRITWVVVPLMLLEATGAIALVVSRPDAVPLWAAWLGLGLVALLWLATALLSVPQHQRLSAAFDERAHDRLVSTNWVRTAGWTARAALLTWLMSGA